METSTFIATGMTCQHCVASVTKHLQELANFTEIVVDLPTGKITVVSDQNVPAEKVIAAIEEAGYSAVANGRSLGRRS